MATLFPPAATASPASSKPTVTEPEKVDYFNLPCPIPYEEIHREALNDAFWEWCELSENLAMKANGQLTGEPHMSHGMVNFDYKGKDYRTQFQLGNGALVGASYIQSVTPHLSLGGEVFWAGQSGFGYAARYNTDKMIDHKKKGYKFGFGLTVGE